MRSLQALICFVLFAGSPVSYLKYERPVHLSASGVQQYIVVDEAIWNHARPDLGDVRLYAGDAEIPYSLVIERDSLHRERMAVPVLQQSTVAGKTQFLVDMSALAEYDHVDLDLTTRNFVAHARVEGENAPQSRTWAVLGDSILYDLSSDGLGSNHMLRLPRTKYRYLRVTIDGSVKPKEVTGAFSETTDEQIAHWRDVAVPGKREEQGKETVFTFTVPNGSPVDRVLLTVDPAQPNFWRRAEIQNGAGAPIASGEIKRIHMVRAGRKIDSEENAVQLIGGPQTPGQTTIKVVVHNGDDPPLRIADVRLQQFEGAYISTRRVEHNSRSTMGTKNSDRPSMNTPDYFSSTKLQRSLRWRQKFRTMRTRDVRITGPGRSAIRSYYGSRSSGRSSYWVESPYVLCV